MAFSSWLRFWKSAPTRSLRSNLRRGPTKKPRCVHAVEQRESRWVPSAVSPPTADAGGPYTAVQGGILRLDGSASTDPDLPNDSLSFAWDLDDNGVFETGGVRPLFLASGLEAGATRTVHLRVTDGSGLTTEATATISITDQPQLQPNPWGGNQTVLVIGHSLGDDTIALTAGPPPGASRSRSTARTGGPSPRPDRFWFTPRAAPIA